MNNNDRTMIVRLEERIKNIQSDIGEIKGSVSNIKGCINTNEIAITKINTSLSDHLKNHSSTLRAAGIVSAIISAIMVSLALVFGVVS